MTSTNIAAEPKCVTHFDGCACVTANRIELGNRVQELEAEVQRLTDKYDLQRLVRREREMRAVVEAAKEMRDLLHLRLRYCPEALWLEENYIKLKDALAALERGGDK